MKTNLILILFTLLIVGCNNHPNTASKAMTEQEWQESKQPNMILVEITFRPTLKLTDEIKNTSLESLIKQGKGQYNKKDKILIDKEVARLMKEEGLSKEFAQKCAEINAYRILTPKVEQQEVKFKYVPISSNLAKIYYLEDKYSFIKNNSEFYNKVINEIHNQNSKKIEEDIKKAWDGYL